LGRAFGTRVTMLVRQMHLGATKERAAKCPLRCPDEIGLARHSSPHAFRHKGDDRAFTAGAELPPQLIEDDDGSRSYHEGLRDPSSELEAGIVIDDELGLFGGDLAPHLLQDEDCMWEAVFSSEEKLSRLCKIEVRKGQSASSHAAPLILVPSGPPSEQKKRHRQMADDFKEKKAKCR